MDIENHNYRKVEPREMSVADDFVTEVYSLFINYAIPFRIVISFLLFLNHRDFYFCYHCYDQFFNNAVYITSTVNNYFLFYLQCIFSIHNLSLYELYN